MKKKFGIIFILMVSAILNSIFTTLSYAEGNYIEPLSKLGEVDKETLGKMKGHWMIEGSQFVFEYTGSFVCRIDGLKYFAYLRNRNHTRIPYVYTVVKSKKTGRLYFARGQYKNGQLVGSTSRIVFKGNDRMIVYKANSQKNVFYKARRVTVEESKQAKK